MEEKMLALDLDGTLVNREKKITPKTKNALMEMQRLGHRVALVTGRAMPGVLPLVEELELKKYDGYMLLYNGGRIVRCSTGDILYQQVLPDEIVPEIFALAAELGIGMLTYNKDESGIIANLHNDKYMERVSFIAHLDISHYENPVAQLDGSVNKCLGTAPVEIAPQIEKKFVERFGRRINVTRSEPYFIELSPLGVDKGGSLTKLCGILGVARENVIACGDGFNDVSMIKYAGTGIAMANAQEPVREAADYITLSNEEDGVAHVIEKFILGRRN